MAAKQRKTVPRLRHAILYDWWRIIVLTVTRTADNNLSMMAAGIAFFGMLALFPGLAAVVSIYGFVADPHVVIDNITVFEPILPAPAYTLIYDWVVQLVTSRRSTLGIASVISILLATWSARAGTHALMTALEVILGGHEPRGFFKNLLIAYGLTLLMIAGTIIALAMVVVVPTLMAHLPLMGKPSLINNLRLLIALSAVVIAIGTLYRYGPSGRARRLPILSFGTFFAAGLWIGVSWLLSLYLAHFPNYDQVYGSLGAVIALLIWFYLSALSVLLGAQLNAVIETRALDMRDCVPEQTADMEHR